MQQAAMFYCRKCGSPMDAVAISADKIDIEFYDSMGGSWGRLDRAYNSETGEPNLANVYRCPQYRRWFVFENDHDIICHYKDDRHYGVRIQYPSRKESE